MNRARQIDFFKCSTKTNFRRPGRPRKRSIGSVAFGGSLLNKGNPREMRPLSTKLPIHVTMKSTQAKGRRSLLVSRAARITQATLVQCAKCSGVRIYRYQNVGNHIHLVLRLHRRQSWARFSRSFVSLLKQRMERLWGESIEQLFDHRPFTHIGTWGREYRNLSDYMLKNLLDSWGIPRTAWNLKQFKAALSTHVTQRSAFQNLGPPGQMILC